MSQFLLKEAGFSLLNLVRQKVDSIFILKPIEEIEEICKHILKYFENKAIRAGGDSEDLLVLRSQYDGIFSLLCLFEESVSIGKVNWAENLIKECYEACGIDLDSRLILLVAVNDFGDYSVIPDALRLLPPELVRIINSNLNKPLDIFQIPEEVCHNLTSISLVGHEVGHVLWNSQEDSISSEMLSSLEPLLTEKEFELKSEIKREAEDIFDLIERWDTEQLISEHIFKFERRMASYIEEYFCDVIGRELLGPSFDVAILKHFGPITSNSIDNLLILDDTHPSEMSRMHDALHSLEKCEQKSKNFKEGFEKILSECKKTIGSAQNHVNSYTEHNAQVISEKLVDTRKPKKTYLFSAKKFDDLLKNVFVEFDGFRPPFETVSDEKPKIISPRQALVAAAVYYHGRCYVRNKFYAEMFDVSGSKIDPKGSVELRGILIKHIQYSIGLFNFVKAANNGVEYGQEYLSKTLWPARKRPLRVGEDPFVVTPSIDPMVQYGSNSVDLRLGTFFLLHRPTRYTHIPSKPPTTTKQRIPIEAFYEDINIPIGREFVLHPHQFVLASTLEYLCLPRAYYALVLGRSTWGRLGLNIATATTVQAGFCGCLTLELRNLGESPLILVPGTRIAQICLIEVPLLRDQPADSSYFKANSKYIGPVGPEIPKKIFNDGDWRILRMVQ